MLPKNNKDRPNLELKYDSYEEDIMESKIATNKLLVMNPYIEKIDEDILYHIALGNKTHDLPKMFGDIKFVVLGGTPKRMEQFAYFIIDEIGIKLPTGTILNDISKASHRYTMFKVGPVLSVSYGMGMASIGILLHELIKLMYHARVENPVFIKIGTCGSFGKKAGTVIISKEVVNDFMKSEYELAILGGKIAYPALLDQELVAQLVSLSVDSDNFETISGRTYCADNFYESSGRSDGAICEFTIPERLKFYKLLEGNEIVNVEMESLALAALTYRANIKSAVITVTLSDRLKIDQTEHSKKVLDEWQMRPQKILSRYIKRQLGLSVIQDTTLRPFDITMEPIVTTPSSQTKLELGKPKRCAPVLCSETPVIDHTMKPIVTMPSSETEIKSAKLKYCAPVPCSKVAISHTKTSQIQPTTVHHTTSCRQRCIRLPPALHDEPVTTAKPKRCKSLEQEEIKYMPSLDDKRPRCAGRSEDPLSSNTCTEQQIYFEERKEQELESEEIELQEDEKLQLSRRKSAMVSSKAVLVDELGPCCSTVSELNSPKSIELKKFGSCCKETENSESSDNDLEG